jgi:hypothetical protein
MLPTLGVLKFHWMKSQEVKGENREIRSKVVLKTPPIFLTQHKAL